MIVPRLRSEARGSGSSSSLSTRIYGGRVNQGNDPDLKRAIQHSYTSQTVRKWEKRWVTIHETSMRVHKWMPVPASVPTHAPQIITDKLPILPKKTQIEQQSEIENTQMSIDDDSTNQSTQN